MYYSCFLGVSSPFAISGAGLGWGVGSVMIELVVVSCHVMAKSAGLLLALGLVVSLPALAEEGHGGSAQGVTVQTLVRSDRSWDGARLPPLDASQPEVSVLRITVPPGVKLKRHLHPVINAGVLLQGRLRVESDNGATLVQGDLFHPLALDCATPAPADRGPTAR